MTLGSLVPGDNRQIDAYVAGPAALLIAKAYKLDDRISQAEKQERADRLSNKDAGDVYRIMAVVEAEEVAQTLATLRNDPRVGDIAIRGMELLHTLFGGANTPGTGLAVEALAGDVPESRIRALAPFYISSLSA
jgi:hypothetical protein